MTDHSEKEKLTCQYPSLILCGGRSRRMGKDKAFLPLGSETVLQRVQKVFASLSESRILVIGHDAPEPANTGFTAIVRDENPDLGPLEGLRVGMQKLAGHEIVVVGTCDAPLVVGAVYRLLLNRLLLSDECDVALPCIDGQHYPLTAVYRRRVLDEIVHMVDKGQLRVRDLLERINVDELTAQEIQVVDPQMETIRNINTRAEYEQMLKEYAHLQQGNS